MPLQWCVANTLEKTKAEQLAEALTVPQIIANILVNRGVETYDQARLFFSPGWNDLHDPFLMKDMSKAVQRIVDALRNNERIFIYGDYDVDGITSVSLITLFLRSQGGNVIYYIPDRIKEGYGLSELGIDQAIEFPLPDAEGRAKLARLYSYGVNVPDDVVDDTVKKTERASPAFIKELMRRAMQFHLERADSSTIEIQDVDSAIEELLFSGGTLNRKLLGAEIDE